MTFIDDVMSRIVRDEAALSEDGLVLAVLRYVGEQIGSLAVYRHPNDFAKITVATTSEMQLRVHVWDRVDPLSPSNIHSHRHPIRSRIVTGAFEETRWLMREGGQQLRRYEFKPGNPGDVELVENGTIRLKKSEPVVRAAGDLYTIPLEDFHDVRPLQTPVVTVFSQDLRERANGLVASDMAVAAVARPSLMRGSECDEVREILSTETAQFAARLESDILLPAGARQAGRAQR